ncbi:hypothetical protein ACP70R_003261 [Stipagrostis hirtigluma subsp. patula]
MAAESERPRTRTSSTCTAETARGTHVFKIAGYSLHRGLGVGKYIWSAPFAVGGHQWRICYYPGGAKEETKDCAAVFLHLISTGVKETVVYDFRLLNQATGLSSSVFSSPVVFNDVTRSWGTSKFKKRTILEAPPYLQDDCVVIECDVNVIKESRVEETATDFEVQVPPPDVLDNLGKLLESGEGADVTFKVKGEVIRAHKIILAMRSPVFKAEFYGPMKENGAAIVIEDMQPAVFKALLHFIYTDSMPAMDLEGDENEEAVKHLLVAADRYGVERMKLLCESILTKKLNVGSLATTLALADQHNCSQLKDACIRFISSSSRMDDVVASQGYAHLKRACPAVIVEMWEKSAKSRKISLQQI